MSQNKQRLIQSNNKLIINNNDIERLTEILKLKSLDKKEVPVSTIIYNMDLIYKITFTASSSYLPLCFCT